MGETTKKMTENKRYFAHGWQWIFLLAVVLLPNTVFYTAAEVLGLSRPLLNIDYIFASLFIAFGYRKVGVALAVLFSLADAFQIVNQIYPFIRISDLLIVLQLLPNASAWHVLVFSAVIFSVAASAILVFVSSQHLSKKPLLFLANCLILWLAIYRVTYPYEINTAWRVERGGMIDSAVLFFSEHRLTGNASKFYIEGDPFDGASKSAVTDIALQPDGRHVLLVVAESWGEFYNYALTDKILEPLTQLSRLSHTGLTKGTTEFVGPTVAAEMRELCGVKLKHLNMLELPDDVNGCLPQKFQDHGFHTVALHAALGSIYWRRDWYPKVGFMETRFKEDGRWQSECKSFPGSCDAELAQVDIQELLKGKKPAFIYWLTLNSHQPYRSEDIRGEYFNCPEFGLANDGEACRMAQLHAQFFSDLADALSGDDIQPVEVLIVGDHPPPLINMNEADKLINFSGVPWLYLALD